MIDRLPTPSVPSALERARATKIAIKSSITRHGLSERAQAVACEISDTLFSKRLDVGLSDQHHVGSIGGLDPRVRYDVLEHLAREAGFTLALLPEQATALGSLRAASALMREASSAASALIDALADDHLDRSEAERIHARVQVLLRVGVTLREWCERAMREAVIHIPSAEETP